MNTRNRVKVKICGNEYPLMTTESEEYIIDIAYELDREMKAVLESNPRVTQTSAAVLVCLDYADKMRKEHAQSDNLREQINDYIKENAALSASLSAVRAEVESLRHALSEANGKKN